MIEVKVGTTSGYIVGSIDPSLLTMLQAEATKMEKLNFEKLDKYQKYLAGHLQHEYALTNPTLVDKINLTVTGCCEVYQKTFGVKMFSAAMKASSDAVDIKYELETGPMWINFMQKYEFNPSHTHSGLFSYVIWVKMPYTLEDERKNWKYVEDSRAGCFAFQYLDCLGDFVTDVQDSVEGGLVFFPSTLTHTVFPFYTSDEYRVSVSGNLFLKEVA